MESLVINNHSIVGWAPYTKKFGFVPDPMLLQPLLSNLNELNAFRYDWRPGLDIPDDPTFDPAVRANFMGSPSRC